MVTSTVTTTAKTATMVVPTTMMGTTRQQSTFYFGHCPQERALVDACKEHRAQQQTGDVPEMRHVLRAVGVVGWMARGRTMLMGGALPPLSL